MKYAITLLLAVGIGSIQALTGTASAVENSGVGGKPANPRPDNSRTESIFVHELKPGESIRDAVRVINNTEQPKTVQVYATDAQVASGGAFACEQKADAADREGSWIKLDKDTVNLGPNGNEVVEFTITVPDNVAVGERNACIAMQALEPSAESGTSGVQLSFRSAIRVAITVPGDFNKQLQFEGLSAKVEKDKVTINEKLYNGGNVSLDTNLETKIDTIFGLNHEKKAGDYPLLSGQSAEFNFDFKRPVWGGLYKVNASASYTSDGNKSLGEKGGNTEKIYISKVIFILPHILLSIFYLLILAGITAYVIRRVLKKRRNVLLKGRAISHAVIKGEDIIEIANNYHSDWKQIVSINELKPPYSLREGAELLVIPGAAYVPIIAKTKKNQKKTNAVKKPKAKKTASTTSKTLKSKKKTVSEDQDEK